MDENEDNDIKNVFESIEKSSEMVNCFGCGKEIKWKHSLFEEIPGMTLPVSVCNESCKKQFINRQIKYHEKILRDLYELKPGLLNCPNCGKDALSVVLRDVPFVTNTGEVFVGMAVHREIIGANGKSIPECFCNLDEEDWKKIFGIGKEAPEDLEKEGK